MAPHSSLSLYAQTPSWRAFTRQTAPETQDGSTPHAQNP